MTTTDRAATYLDDLARMLADLDPADRDEVLAGVREHLDATLSEHPDDPAALDLALTRLGPPERVAAEARAGLPARPAPGPSAPAATRGLGRVGVVLTAVATLLPPPLAAVDLGQRITGTGSMFGGGDIVLFLAGSVLFWPWVVGLVCVLAARGFTDGTRVRLVLAGPVTAAVVVLAVLWNNPETLSAAVGLALVGVLVVGLLGVVRRGWREMSGD